MYEHVALRAVWTVPRGFPCYLLIVANGHLEERGEGQCLHHIMSKFDNVYGCRHLLNDGIVRATDVPIGGKHALIGCYGDVGRCSFTHRGSVARKFISDCDPFLGDLRACVEGFQVAAIESVVSEIAIFVSPTGNNVIVGSFGLTDNEIDLSGLQALEGLKAVNIKLHVCHAVFTLDKV